MPRHLQTPVLSEISLMNKGCIVVFMMSQIDKVFAKLWPHSVWFLCAVSKWGHEALKLYIFMFIDKQNEIWNTAKCTK